MHQYRPKTALALILDRFSSVLFAFFLGIAWFIAIWGVRLTALTAGLAFGALIWLCMNRYGRHCTAKKEQQIRRRIGGELALYQMLTDSSEENIRNLIEWLSQCYPIVVQKKHAWGFLGQIGSDSILVRIIVQHSSVQINAQQIVDIQRVMKQYQGYKCILCLTAPLSKEAFDYIHNSVSDVRLIQRDELIEMAGKTKPATNADLMKFREKKTVWPSKAEWIQMVLSPHRLRNYLGYGFWMLTLAILTGKVFFWFPSAVCLLLYTAGKLKNTVSKQKTDY